MTRISRCIAMLGVACLLAFGSVGDSQVPGDGAGPLFLRDQADIDVFRNVISSYSHAWTTAFQSQRVLADLRFRAVISTSLSRGYLGSFEFRTSGFSYGASAGAGSASSTSTTIFPQSGVHSFGYLHVLGSGCAMPPDMLFVGRPLSIRSKSARPGCGIENTPQLEFLLFALEGLAGQGTNVELIGFRNWFASLIDVAIVDFDVAQTGTTFRLDLWIRDCATPSIPPLVRSVQAERSSAGAFDQVVIK